MDQNALLIVITVFVIVAAVALCFQAGFLFATYKTTQALQQKILPLVPKVEALLPKIEALLPKLDALIPKVGALVDSSRVAIEDGSRQIHEIADRTNEILIKTSEILDSGKAQMARVDDVMQDATARAHIQLDRAEMVIDDTMNRAQETVALVHSGIMKPLREIQGLSAGVKAAITFFTRGRNGPVHATADEEMFI